MLAAFVCKAVSNLPPPLLAFALLAHWIIIPACLPYLSTY
jgi:hypothetical protein